MGFNSGFKGLNKERNFLGGGGVGIGKDEYFNLYFLSPQYSLHLEIPSFCLLLFLEMEICARPVSGQPCPPTDSSCGHCQQWILTDGSTVCLQHNSGAERSQMRSGKTGILVDIVTGSVRMWEKNLRAGATMLLPSASSCHTILKYLNTSYTADALTVFQHARAQFTSSHQKTFVY